MVDLSISKCVAPLATTVVHVPTGLKPFGVIASHRLPLTLGP